MQQIFFQRKNILNFLICLFPLSFIFGNLITNIEIILISLLGIFIYKKKIFLFENKKTIIVLFTFFLLLIFSTTLYHNFNLDSPQVIKSILFMRYFIFFLVLSTVVKNQDFNFKYFSLTCFLITIFLSIDIIFQSYMGINLFGYNQNINHNSSIFGKELIAGSYIQRFSLIGLIFLAFISNKFNKILLYMSFSILILGIGIFFSGNRMPFILFIFSIFISLIFIKKYRTIIFITLSSLLIFLIILLNNNSEIKKKYISFFDNSIYVAKILKDEIKNSFEETNTINLPGSGHGVIFASAIHTWLEKPLLGRGIKSFGITCQINQFVFLPGKTEYEGKKNRICAPHPHNYYLEILNDTGLIGIILLFIFIILIGIKNINFYREKNFKNKIINYILILTLLIEFTPLRSSGSFFSTGNASFIFFLLGIIINLQKKKIIKHV